MNNFQNMVDVKNWLSGQARGVITIFAARAALRFMPYLHGIESEPDKEAPALILPPCYTGLAVLSAWAYADRDWEIIEEALSCVEDMTFDTVDDDVTSAAAFANNMASSFSYAATTAALDFALHQEGSTSLKATLSSLTEAQIWDAFMTADVGGDYIDGIFASAALYKSYTADAQFIAAGGDARGLARQSLWADAAMPSDIQKEWTLFKRKLLPLNQDWDIWTDWYEARLRGMSEMEQTRLHALEIAKLDCLERHYKDVDEDTLLTRSPALINGELKKIITDFTG